MTIERSTTQRAMPRNSLRHTGWLLLLLVAACATRPAALEHRPYDVAQAGGWQAEVDAAARLPAEAFQADRFRSASGAELPYRWLAPDTPEAGRRYPLVVLLHGSGAVGIDNASQLGAFFKTWSREDIRRRYPAYVVVPQFPVRSANYRMMDGTQVSEPDPVLDTALAMIERFSADHAVDRQRLYVVGFSMGASAAWNAMAKRPDLFAAGVPISGIPPSAASAAALAPLPILIVHGTADTENEIGPDRVMYRALIGQGAARVRMREYDGLDHRIATELFASDTGWRDWLFAQRRR